MPEILIQRIMQSTDGAEERCGNGCFLITAALYSCKTTRYLLGAAAAAVGARPEIKTRAPLLDRWLHFQFLRAPP